MQPEKIQDLEVLLGHSFRDRDFLVNALSHSSIKNEHRPSNERLEFLGDSVLGLIISDALYRRFPRSDEGTLTRIKSQAVSRATLQRVAVAMGLDRFILVGKGVAKREIPGSLLGNLFEAIVGAIYLDSGLAAARKFVLRHLDIIVEEIVEDRAEKNYKSMLQHHCQRELGAVPVYRVLREAGPAHSRNFDVAVLISGKEYGRARAQAKKEAEQGAARAAMIHLKVVHENPNKPVRGAGTILRAGPESARKKSRGKAGRGRKEAEAERAAPPGAAAPEAPVAPAHTPGAEKQSSRRSSRRRRGGGRAGAAKESREGAAADTDAPAAREAKAPPPAADEAAPAPEPKRKSRRKSKRKKKTTAEPKAGDGAGGTGDEAPGAGGPAKKATPDGGGDAPAKPPRRRGRRGGRKRSDGGDKPAAG